MEERWADIPNNLTAVKSLKSWAKGKCTVDGNIISYNGVQLPEELNSRINKMFTNGESPAPVFKFWERLEKNPSFRSVQQLWAFLNQVGIPLTPDGCFLAYKSVKGDYTDVYTGTVSNKPGSINEMPRNQISDDPKVDCHVGFHVGALKYAQEFAGTKIVICKVDPEHVVCVPYDNSQQKMRVCKYEVIGNYGAQLPSTSIEDDETDDVEEEIEQDGDIEEETKSVVSAPENVVVDGIKISKGDATLIKGKPKTSTKKPTPMNFGKMNTKQLLDVSLDELRKYAGHSLKIVGASKIPGGKLALIKAIQKVRS